MKELLEIGQIVNSYGIKGFAKVVPFTDNIERFENLEYVYIENKNKFEEFSIEEIKYSKNLVLMKLKGIDTIEQIEKYKNCYLKIDRKDSILLEENQFFIVDLLGLEVYTIDNILLGKVEDIYPTGSNDIYVVKDDKGKQILLPAIADVIKNVDIPNKKITVELIDGLI